MRHRWSPSATPEVQAQTPEVGQELVCGASGGCFAEGKRNELPALESDAEKKDRESSRRQREITHRSGRFKRRTAKKRGEPTVSSHSNPKGRDRSFPAKEWPPRDFWLWISGGDCDRRANGEVTGACAGGKRAELKPQGSATPGLMACGWTDREAGEMGWSAVLHGGAAGGAGGKVNGGSGEEMEGKLGGVRT